MTWRDHLDDMPVKVTIHHFSTSTSTGYNPDGSPNNPTDEILDARIEISVEVIKDQDGTNKSSKRTTVYLGTTGIIHPESLITLPAGYSPRLRLPLRVINPVYDEDQVHHTEVTL